MVLRYSVSLEANLTLDDWLYGSTSGETFPDDGLDCQDKRDGMLKPHSIISSRDVLCLSPFLELVSVGV